MTKNVNHNNKNAFFLKSLHKILVMIRSDVENDMYLSFLLKAKECLEYNNLSDRSLFFMLKFKSIVIILSDVFNKDIYLLWRYLFCKASENSKCNNWEVVKNKQKCIYLLIIELSNLIIEKKFEQAYDLADAIESLPEAILLKEKWDESAYHITHILPYQIKWGIR